ncbi:MAG: phycobiliprotein asparagine N-methyltransferase [Phormidesmis priestleyi Ana]|uniref:Phycobiliprotein asparagine N-methyltransferase n=1 Tax=Phormidesmis priestleyi Ana TaxID=1666911 RepID=A0A0P7ZWB7_9CYAN|nr:MAG: phycobiliprotein asparagine N-methyltransferase [Phormidesmis priestleyi Ana]
MSDKQNKATPAENARVETVSSAVAKLYDTYPFPPEPLLDEAPPGYNWRWHWPSAYSFCTGRSPERNQVRILDAGCGTGVGTEYLVHLNPEAEVVGMDLSAGAIAVATERCRRSRADRVTFHNLSIYDVAQIPGEFDLINCVGVLHHMPDPIRGIQALATKLKPGGLLHVFVYAELGRWEIQLTQEAIALLQGAKRGDYTDGVGVGRTLFSSLPEQNRLRRREETRWALENQRDECFADMYVHPQEIDYNVKTLFELIDSSGLDFVGFSNPQYWDLSRLVGTAPDLMARAKGLEVRDRYRLIELLDPEITHYEFFLSRPPLEKTDWTNNAELLAAIPERHACIEGWPSRSFFNFDYQVVSISDAEYAFLEKCDPAQSQCVAEIFAAHQTNLEEGLKMVRQLQSQQLIVLSKSQK